MRQEDRIRPPGTPSRAAVNTRAVSLAARFRICLRTFFCRDLGRAGERAAECFLRTQGLFPVSRNWRARGGELDLIAVTPENALVFVEVKTTLRRQEDAWSRIDAAKERHLLDAATDYCRAHGLGFGEEHRFDAVLVLGDPRSLRRPLRFVWVRGIL